MKLTIEPTDQFFLAGDVMVRAWNGKDETGADLVAMVCMVAFPANAQYLLETGALVSIPPPTPQDAQRWATKIMESTAAPGHTDLMISPEAIDECLRANPPPDDPKAAVTPPGSRS